ncbi:hypothetical protein IAR55_002737 [Kwoniella newhampshirensis]|uniref:Anaphase-promoting complex subunit 13 n=1 Tax=Kwoniella newhampshirensis TaxID=1651941 RepID=A0AAW0YZS1_9TREE
MTTSITDARYNVLHQSVSHTLSLSFDDPPETGWSVMPGFDESLSIPPHLEPPRLDADETLPSMLHPSYPFGRPVSLRSSASISGIGIGVGGGAGRGRGIGNLLGTITVVGEGGRREGGFGLGRDGGGGGGWDEWGLEDVVENERRKEIPPGMAGAKRPPSPPSPALRPSHVPLPRSLHLRHLLERQQQASPAVPNDGFDAPVPNETYEEEQGGNNGQTANGVGVEGRDAQGQGQDQEGQRIRQQGQVGDRGRGQGFDEDDEGDGGDGEVGEE